MLLAHEAIAPGITLFAGRAGGAALAATLSVLDVAPPRRMTTPGGRPMSVAMTSCGRLGWVSDAAGYRYVAVDPMTGRPWPAMPDRRTCR